MVQHIGFKYFLNHGLHENHIPRKQKGKNDLDIILYRDFDDHKIRLWVEGYKPWRPKFNKLIRSW